MLYIPLLAHIVSIFTNLAQAAPRPYQEPTNTEALLSRSHSLLGTRNMHSTPSPKLPRHSEQPPDPIFDFISRGIHALQNFETDDGEQPYEDAVLFEVTINAGELSRNPSDFTIFRLNFRWYDESTQDLLHISFANDHSASDDELGSWSEEPSVEEWNDGYESYYSEVQPLNWEEMKRSGTTLKEAFEIIEGSGNLNEEQMFGEWDRISVVKFASPRRGLGDEIVYEFNEEVFVGVDVKEAVPVPARENQRELGWMGRLD